MDCPSCGTANPVGKRFCGDCGAALPPSCAACGAENAPDKRFCGNCGAALAEATPSRPSSEVVAQAERRQVTVMFCDLVELDRHWPRARSEDLREVISAYHGSVAATVRRYDGFVAKFMGDGVLDLFRLSACP